MWFLLMLVILLTNGMSAFGLKVIAGWGLPPAAKFPYLTVWYGTGLAVLTLPTLLRGVHLRWQEGLWGLIMAALSMGGQVAMAAALASDVPGHVVFPVAVGGSVLVIAAAGRIFFGERMNRMTAVGIVVGLWAVILLSVA